MKKHKVKIPKGYVLVNENRTKIDGFMTITLGLEPIPMEKQAEMSNKEPLAFTVDIPSGYEFESVSPCTEDAGKNMISTTVVFQKIKKELPETWEEYISVNKTDWNRWFFVNEEYYTAFDALRKLIELRDHYNDGCSEDGRYSIINNKYNSPGKELMISDSTRGPLLFINGYRCEMFLSNFRDLLEIAEPLL